MNQWGGLLLLILVFCVIVIPYISNLYLFYANIFFVGLFVAYIDNIANTGVLRTYYQTNPNLYIQLLQILFGLGATALPVLIQAFVCNSETHKYES